MPDIKKSYLIYVLDGGKPNQIYETYEGALKRAEILAAETRKPVVIFTSTQVVTAEVPDISATYNVEEII